MKFVVPEEWPGAVKQEYQHRKSIMPGGVTTAPVKYWVADLEFQDIINTSDIGGTSLAFAKILVEGFPVKYQIIPDTKFWERCDECDCYGKGQLCACGGPYDEKPLPNVLKAVSGPLRSL